MSALILTSEYGRVMTPQDKVALLLKTLGPEVAESVLTNLETGQSQLLRTRLTDLEKKPPEAAVLHEVLQEFEGLLRQPPPAAEEAPRAATPPPAGGTSAPHPEAAAAPSSEHAEALPDPMAAIRLLDPERLASALKGENPRTVALILGSVDATRAGEVLKRMPVEFRREIVPFLGKPVTMGAEVVQRIARAVLQKCQAVKEEAAVQSPAKKMADILRCLDKPERLDLLAALEERDPELAAAVKELLYQFEDLLLIEDRSMQKLLSEVDSRSLATALKGATDEIKEKVMNNLSKRARESLGEEMEFLGSVAAGPIQQAQKAIVEAIQRLDQAGELTMKQ